MHPGDSMTIDVYQTDAEAFEATAALAAETLRATVGRRLSVALAGGRGGRGVMLALAARSDVPWERVEWFWGDERCVPPSDPRSNVKVACDSLFVPRGIESARIHRPDTEQGDAALVAAGYATGITAALGGGTPPIFDLILLGVGLSGAVASLMPGSGALSASAAVVGVPREEVSEEPHVARITLTPPVLHAARRVIVTAVGDDKSRVVAQALGSRASPTPLPAQLLPPSPRVAWIIDRAAAAELLRGARPAAP